MDNLIIYNHAKFTGENEGQLNIYIQSWILTQKQIPFKF
jgi:hypothetical protein